MTDVETRYRIHDAATRERVADLLEGLGYGYEEDVSMYDAYYEGACLDPGDSLRLRHEHGGADDFSDLLTWQGHATRQSGVLERDEINVSVDPEIHDILAALGFTVCIRIQMSRQRYRHQDVLASIDVVDGHGTFLTIQLVAPGPATDEHRQRLLEEGRRLRFGDHEVVAHSYLQLAQMRKGFPG